MATLSSGLELKSLNGISYKVKKFLASGSQGSVYEVTDGRDHYALKWYKNGSNALKMHFRDLLQRGMPRGKDNRRDTRFIWPEDLVEYGDGFGYIMEFIDMRKYNTLFKIISKDQLYPNHSTLCKICIEMADAFDNLHTAGLCYKDLSHNNILIDNSTGEILIVDVDNVCVSGVAGDIAGTPKFMAPEVVLGKGGPDRESDRFSLAAIYFYLLLGHNPLEGKLRDDYVKKNGTLDQESFKYIYGTNATFCFNEQDKRNCLQDNEYKYIVKRWESIIPEKMKKKFEKTFVTALSFDKRGARTTDKEWILLFTEMQNNIKRCSCGKEYFSGASKCYHCSNVFDTSAVKAPTPSPASAPAPAPAPVTNPGSMAGVSLAVRDISAQGINTVVLTEGSSVSGAEIGASLASYQVFGQVLKNPKTGELGLRNLSQIDWYYKDPSSPQLETVAPGKIILLKSGRIVAFIKGTIQATVI